MNMPLVLLNRRRRGFTAFSPSTLFALAEPGVWFDPSDLTTLFTDPAGTTPVTAPGNTVGLMLDKSKGLALGAELVTNGDFSGGTTGWTPQDANVVLSTSGGAGVATYSATSTFYQAVSVQAGKTYRATAIIKRDSGSGTPFMNFRSGTTLASGVLGESSPTGYASASYVFASAWFVAASTGTVYLHFPCTAAASTVVSIDNISVRELPGSHATQATLAARPTYSIEPVGGRRNLLTWTEQFDNAAWQKAAATVTANASVAPDGTTTADLLLPTAANADHYLDVGFGFNIAAVSGTQYALSTSAKANGYRWLRLAFSSAIMPSANRAAWFDLQTGTLGTVQSGVTATMTPEANGFYRCSIARDATVSATPGQFGFIQVTNADNATAFAGNGTSGILLWGAQLEAGTLSPYQRVTTQHDVTEAGVASVGYLYFDGVSDAMVTSTITPGIDKAQVFAGVRKVSDALAGMVAELSINVSASPGSFYVTAPENLSNLYLSLGRGSANAAVSQASTTGTTGAAPDSAVISIAHDIAGDLSTIRRNSVAGTSGTADKGVGNFLAYPLFIGARNQTSVFFTGHLYSLITRFGPTLDAPTIASTETWVAGKTGITI